MLKNFSKLMFDTGKECETNENWFETNYQNHKPWALRWEKIFDSNSYIDSRKLFLIVPSTNDGFFHLIKKNGVIDEVLYRDACLEDCMLEGERIFEDKVIEFIINGK
jgi:hypothetical protein